MVQENLLAGKGRTDIEAISEMGRVLSKFLRAGSVYTLSLPLLNLPLL
jgi:hypothetical protein